MSDQQPGQAYNVLLVEDNPDDAELCLRALQKAQLDSGIEICARAVIDSTQAAILLNEEKFDAVFLDVSMPSIDGIELARSIRASTVNRFTLIVVITGTVDRGLMARAYQAGANFFLSKPTDRIQLRRLIQVMQGSMQRERRRFHRVRAECKVAIESEQGRVNGRTLDLSLNGMLVQADRLFRVGAAVLLALELPPEATPVRIAARVIRIVGNDCMGFQFERVGKAESEKLGEFLVPLIAAALDEDRSERAPA